MSPRLRIFGSPEVDLTPFLACVFLKPHMYQIADIIQNTLVPAKPHPQHKYEFQVFGRRLAKDLNDMPKLTLYIKLAKEENRGLLEQAKEHVLWSANVQNRGALFMWKLGQLKQQKVASY